MAKELEKYKSEISDLKARIRSMEMLQDELPDLMFIKDKEHRFLEANLACAKYMAGEKATPADIIGKTDYDFYSREEADRFHEDEDTVMREGKSMINKDEPRESNDGGESWILSSKYPARNEDGEVTGIIGVSHDISDFKSAQTNAAIASRMEATATLAGGIAHKFNNLMAIVLGHATMMDVSKNRSAKAIEIAAKEAGELAHQMLAFARGGRIVSLPVDFNSVVRERVAFINDGIKSRIDIKLELSDECSSIHANPRQMEMVVSSVIRNAVESIEDTGVISISTAPTNSEGVDSSGFVTFIVEDSGCGMTQDELVKIYEPFYTSKFQGRGLGLAAVYGIVHNHNGSIVTESKLEMGTKVTICIPVRDVPEELLESAAAGVDDASGTETLLVVDDEPSIRKVFSMMLANRGYTTLSAANGFEALDALSANPDVALIVLDLEMTGMNGREAYTRIKEVNSDVKVLVCSGFNLSDEINELLNEHGDRFAQKPLSSDGLSQRVRSLLDS